jgi:hypothetical protein
MTRAETLEALARRCAAVEAGREVDRDIALAFGLYDRPEELGCFVDPAKAVVSGGGQTWAPPCFTTSLDAAMSLMPEGWDRLEVYTPDYQTLGWTVYILPAAGRLVEGKGFAQSYAAALTAACLRAHATKDND